MTAINDISTKKNISTSSLVPNNGQLKEYGVPKNPRFIRDDKFSKLCKSLREHPEMLTLREVIVYPFGKKYVVICGNMRFRAAKEVGIEEVPCKVLFDDTSADDIIAYASLDNNEFGEYDWDIIHNEWDVQLLEEWGIDVQDISPKKSNSITDFDDDSDDEEGDDDEDDDNVSPSLQILDLLYESDNEFEIPTLLIEQQAGKLELPLTPWGANSRIRKDVTTYHFYVDDYRFERLWKDPINLLASGCKAIVEPNCSLHDQTPIAYGLHLIYKKRWLARYMQDCGVKVYADLNVSHKFKEYNKLGIPKGYNAFFTRGTTGWVESLKHDLEVAREISGRKTPNLIVYGGGSDCKNFCMENNLLYVTDFINSK